MVPFIYILSLVKAIHLLFLGGHEVYIEKIILWLQNKAKPQIFKQLRRFYSESHKKTPILKSLSMKETDEKFLKMPSEKV